MGEDRLWDYAYTAVGIGRHRERVTFTEAEWNRNRNALNGLGWVLINIDRRPHDAPPPARRPVTGRPSPVTVTFEWRCSDSHHIYVVSGRVPRRARTAGAPK
jgi:hypothetical protein